jgi:hypothetical protein
MVYLPSVRRYSEQGLCTVCEFAKMALADRIDLREGLCSSESELPQQISQRFEELHIATDGTATTCTVTPFREERLGGRVEQTMQSVRGKTQSNR